MLIPEILAKCNRPTQNTSRTALAVQLRYLLNHQWLAIDSNANPHLNDDPGAIIAFPDETIGLADPVFYDQADSVKCRLLWVSLVFAMRYFIYDRRTVEL